MLADGGSAAAAPPGNGGQEPEGEGVGEEPVAVGGDSSARKKATCSAVRLAVRMPPS